MYAKGKAAEVVNAAMDAGWQDCMDSLKRNPTYDSKDFSDETLEFLKAVWGHGFACGAEFEQTFQKE